MKIKIKLVNMFQNILNGILSFYWILYCAITPILIGMIPVILCVIFKNDNWLYSMILSIPIGAHSMKKLWESDYLSNHIKKYI
jgi:hypothetical protein